MPHDAAGNRLFKRVDIKVFFPEDTMPAQKISQHAPPGKGFSADNLDDILMRVADQLDTRFPWWDFSYLELAPVGRTAAFRFNCVGYRKGFKMPEQTTEKPKEDSSILEPPAVRAITSPETTKSLEKIQRYISSPRV